MKKFTYIIFLFTATIVGCSSCSKDDKDSKSDVNLPISGSYVWEFRIPVGKQVMTLDFSNEIIKLKMVGEKDGYSNEYDMIPISYNETNQKIIAKGKGGKTLSKEGVYFAIFIKDITPEHITIFKKEFETKEEAEKYPRPENDETESHGWNVFDKQ